MKMPEWGFPMVSTEAFVAFAASIAGGAVICMEGDA
jgi:hypothetical protein